MLPSILVFKVKTQGQMRALLINLYHQVRYVTGRNCITTWSSVLKLLRFFSKNTKITFKLKGQGQIRPLSGFSTK